MPNRHTASLHYALDAIAAASTAERRDVELALENGVYDRMAAEQLPPALDETPVGPARLRH